jgi:hypothetical protein
MHQYEQVLRDRTTTGREAGRAGPWSLPCKLDTEKRVKKARLHARGNRTSEDLNASHARPDSPGPRDRGHRSLARTQETEA